MRATFCVPGCVCHSYLPAMLLLRSPCVRARAVLAFYQVFPSTRRAQSSHEAAAVGNEGTSTFAAGVMGRAHVGFGSGDRAMA
ncbi:hypothetical protein FB45DRAFT_941187 [Roridomyces roridus]|uniref:Uncharacterized protein n=1 Tax=Roridomyces roridus TaxID=1738132 RepID=A0AAD7B598_9AGAR|nr:hypothetical protein FB45DRAFT_941187 [Roridomyces roridus]